MLTAAQLCIGIQMSEPIVTVADLASSIIARTKMKSVLPCYS